MGETITVLDLGWYVLANSVAAPGVSITVPQLQIEGVSPQRPSTPAGWVLVLKTHWLFGCFLALGIVMRATVWYVYRPTLWYLGDSISYLANALKLAPDVIRPSGYSFFLAGLEPAHRLYLVTASQHAMGLGIAILSYSWLIRHGVRVWIAALSVTPLLLDGYVLQLEQLLLSDTLFVFLVLTGLVALLWSSGRDRWRSCLLAGAMLGMAATTRTVGIGVVLLSLGGVVLLRLPWKSVLIVLLAIATPVGAYVDWFHAHHGQYALTAYSGDFLYARTMPWSSCNGVQLTALESTLCNGRPSGQRPSQNWDMWSLASPLNKLPGDAHARSAVAESFARKMILHDPLGYLNAVGGSLVQTFAWHENSIEQGSSYAFVTASPPLPDPPASAAKKYQAGPAGNTRVDHPRLARFLADYQRYVRTPGPLYLIGVLLGLGGAVLGWRRRRPRPLLAGLVIFGLVGLYLLTIASFTAFYDPRYVLAALPMCCIAGGAGLEIILDLGRPKSPDDRAMMEGTPIVSPHQNPSASLERVNPLPRACCRYNSSPSWN